MDVNRRLDSAYWALRVGLGLTAFLAGLDKYFNLLANWSEYVSPLAEAVLPVTAETFMLVVGVIEMAVGLAVLTKWTRIGAYIAGVWLLAIALNLVTTGLYFDIASAKSSWQSAPTRSPASRRCESRPPPERRRSKPARNPRKAGRRQEEGWFPERTAQSPPRLC